MNHSLIWTPICTLASRRTKDFRMVPDRPAIKTHIQETDYRSNSKQQQTPNQSIMMKISSAVLLLTLVSAGAVSLKFTYLVIQWPRGYCSAIITVLNMNYWYWSNPIHVLTFYCNLSWRTERSISYYQYHCCRYYTILELRWHCRLERQLRGRLRMVRR